MKRSTKIVIGVVVAAVLAFVVAPWVYINMVRDDAPERLTLATTPSTTSEVETVSPDEPFDPSGGWIIADGSVVGYRVEEILFGQNVTAVGRTESVTGGIVLVGDSVTEGGFVVDMATLVSDSSRRDGQVNGRILQTATYPQAVFELSAPIALPMAAFDGDPVQVEATGSLTLLDVTREVTVMLDVQLVEDAVNIVGSIPVVFTEWNIPDPSTGGITVDPEGLLEFSLVLRQQG
jgi:polyisoprenoid-binding protein YceI